jgi:endoribonuclease LACTB2
MGLNPGPMTLDGTNTYIVGSGNRRCLVDTAEGIPQYLEALKAALAASEEGCVKPEIASIVLTHWHRDHVGGVPHVKGAFPNAVLYKVPSLCAAAQHEEASATNNGLLALIDPMIALPKSLTTQRPFLAVDDESTLEFVLTPGHTDDHVTLRLVEENALFTGDCILGAGSSVFACYAEYMASLETLKDLNPTLLYPGHGPVVNDAMGRIMEQIAHRGKREEQILSALKALSATSASPSSCDGSATIVDIVGVVYRDVPPHLHPAAAFNVLHNMKKLLRDGKCFVASSEADKVTQTFRSMGDYDGGEGATEDMNVVANIVQHLKWGAVHPSL